MLIIYWPKAIDVKQRLWTIFTHRSWMEKKPENLLMVHLIWPYICAKSKAVSSLPGITRRKIVLIFDIITYPHLYAYIRRVYISHCTIYLISVL